MASISTAISSSRISTIVGYEIKAGDVALTSNYLPQRIVVIGEGLTANQSTMPLDETEISTAYEAGTNYGFGSPIHKIFNILKPNGVDLLGGIPTYVIAQEEASSGVAAVVVNTVSGTATGTSTHYVYIAGRDYSYSIATGDTATEIAQTIADTVNSDASSPVTAVADSGTITFTAKWAGATSTFTTRFYTSGAAVGITYSEDSTTDGSGTPDLSTLSDKLGNEWTTIIINSYGEPAFDTLESINGHPDDTLSTGRFYGEDFRPFIAIWGSTEKDTDVLGEITDSRESEVTNALAPAPGSEGFPFEAAANMTLNYATLAQDEPHRDVINTYYNDMPGPSDDDIGNMKSYTYRDALVKKGCSTVDYEGSTYKIKDFVTTYHPESETYPTFRWVSRLNLDFNIRYFVMIAEQTYLVGRAIIDDDQVSSVGNTIKAKDWKGILYGIADDLGDLAIINDVDYMKENIEVEVDESNGDRFNTTFSYQTSGTARISSTTATVYRQSVSS